MGSRSITDIDQAFLHPNKEAPANVFPNNQFLGIHTPEELVVIFSVKITYQQHHR
jgi:hypothetical protein